MKKKLFFIFLGLIVYWSCQDIATDRDNPFDPGNPDYEPPEVVLTSPHEGETINEYPKS